MDIVIPIAIFLLPLMLDGKIGSGECFFFCCYCSEVYEGHGG